MKSLLSSRFKFTDPACLHLLAQLLPSVYSSSESHDYVSLTMVYEMIWSHSEFLKVMCSSLDEESALQLADVKGIESPWLPLVAMLVLCWVVVSQRNLSTCLWW